MKREPREPIAPLLPAPRQGLMSAMLLAVVALAMPALASYANFEASHVHPIALTPSGTRLLVVNTPDAMLEIYAVEVDGTLLHSSSVPTGLEPVSVIARTDAEAWVVNQLSDSVSIVDLSTGNVVRTLRVGDEPSDVAFALGKAFVSISGEDVVKVYTLTDLDIAPSIVPIFSRRPRALAVKPGGAEVYAIALESGNQTTVVNGNVIFSNYAGIDPTRAAELGLDDLKCDGAPPPDYPPLPPGIDRNPVLVDPPDGVPKVALIVKWNDASGRWEDEANENWSHCLPLRLPDHDLFVIDSSSLTVTEVDHLGTTLFDVSVRPTDGRIYVPNTEARNFVRFEHALGLRGHVVDNRLSIVDPAASNAVSVIDLNDHIDRTSDPETNLAEREAAISQPGMMVWKSDGTVAYLTGIGTRKVFEIDASCPTADCVFGPDRAAPNALEVGEGPTGVALHEPSGKLYVLNRFANTISIVDTTLPTLNLVDTVAMHDPSDDVLRDGRRLLYDAILGSGHGDAACSSCHTSGDKDGLVWDLGDPTGELVPYVTADDNVRFTEPSGGVPVECTPDICAQQQGFDPQKGPMATQTFRGMLEPLHWRGDRPTFSSFNAAFVGLMGTADIGPPGAPGGLTPEDMALYRRFALGIRFPPNPLRNVDDTLPAVDVPIPGTAHVGNPTTGKDLFRTAPVSHGEPCVACHAQPFGAAGGVLDGVTPSEPTSPEAAALVNGAGVRSRHSDLQIPHLRNAYQKTGMTFGRSFIPDAQSGFGLTHDGAIPDLVTFVSSDRFAITSDESRDLAAFVAHFPTGTKPCVGHQVTLPQGIPPTGSPAEETFLQQLVSIADLNDPSRHGELIATALVGGRIRAYHLNGSVWVPDIASEAPLTIDELRQAAIGPITFMCTPIDSGIRLGGDRDEDTHRNGDDCAPADPATWTRTAEVPTLWVVKAPQTQLRWDPQSGPGLGTVTYEIAGGGLVDLRTSGLGTVDCVKGDLTSATWDDTRPDPPAGDGYVYFVRARNACGPSTFGPGLSPIDPLDCRGF